MDLLFYDALIDHFNAKRSRAESELLTYLANPTGIGEHSDLLGEMIKKVEELDHANSCLNTLESIVAPFVDPDLEVEDD